LADIPTFSDAILRLKFFRTDQGSRVYSHPAVSALGVVSLSGSLRSICIVCSYPEENSTRGSGLKKKLSRRAVLSGLALSALSPLARAARASEPAPRPSEPAPHPSQPAPIIDTHVHFPRTSGGEAYDFAEATALREMDHFGIETAILSPPPLPPGARRARLSDLSAAARRDPRFAFAAGGESLNPILQDTPADRVSADRIRDFTAIAEEIAAAGAASFGELAAEHFSSGRGRHPYESSPPDHPLLLALADIAARHGMPIDLHMEAVPEDMLFPPNRQRGPNPERLSANIARLERLLNHNPAACIVWLHAGWDLTGERTLLLMRGLLERHRNLAMSIKSDHSGAKLTAPFFPDGGDIRPGWIAMLGAFPDRFMIGSDQFLGEDTERLEQSRRLVDALPADLKSLVASKNAKRLYRLAET
jgi:predicted TIM-barrel fold metal-dependent hydrolase